VPDDALHLGEETHERVLALGERRERSRLHRRPSRLVVVEKIRARHPEFLERAKHVGHHVRVFFQEVPQLLLVEHLVARLVLAQQRLDLR